MEKKTAKNTKNAKNEKNTKNAKKWTNLGKFKESIGKFQCFLDKCQAKSKGNSAKTQISAKKLSLPEDLPRKLEKSIENDTNPSENREKIK